MYGERQFFYNGCWHILTGAEEVGGIDLGCFLSDPGTEGAAPPISNTRNAAALRLTNAKVTTLNYTNVWKEGHYH